MCTYSYTCNLNFKIDKYTMIIESIIVLNNITTPLGQLFTPKFKGAGYYRKHGGIQTFQFKIEEFKGTITVQGTLEMYPGENDWVDLKFQSGLEIAPNDSTASSGTFIRNIQGNWVWLRVSYALEEGTITYVQYNI